MIGSRLKEERNRLGWTVPAMAEKAGVARNTILNWQNGSSSPPVETLAKLGGEGIDLVYVLLGQRSTVLPGASEEERAEITALVDCYLCLEQDGRDALQSVASALVGKAVDRGTAKLIRKVAPAPDPGAESALPTSDEAQS